MIKNRLWFIVVASALACAPRGGDATKDTLASVDTLKPATDTLATADSLPTATQTKSGTTTAPVNSKTTAGTKAKRDSIIGRDSVTPFDPNRPLLPPAKRP